MTTLADKVILLGADNHPPMLKKDMYSSWKSIMELYMMNRQHERMIIESVENGPLIWPSIEENRERECKLYDEFDKFAYKKEETLHSGLIVPVFQKGDDPIDAINHMMLFLTAVVTFRYPPTNNQLRNSSNPRQQATINNRRVIHQFFYDHITKQALGFQNPFYLKKAHQLEPKLYDGNVIQKTNAIVIRDSEETLMLAEKSRSKMLLKQKDLMMSEKKVNTKPIDCAVLNQLSQDFETRFVPQTELSAEQAFWCPSASCSHYAEQRLARKNELKARDTLLMALLDKHQLKFNSHKDAKTLMEAIEKRFGGNTETKKVQKTLLKQQFKNFTGSNSEGLDHIHYRLQKLTHTLIWRNKADLEEQSLDDLFNSLKIYETKVKQSSSIGTVSQNLAFVSSSHTDSTTDSVSVAASVFAACVNLPAFPLPNVDSLINAIIYSFFASQSTSPQLDNKDLKQIDVDDLEEMDLRWQMAMLTIQARRFLQKTGRNLGANGPTSMGFDMSKVKCYNCHRKGHFARECRSPKDPRMHGSYDWSYQEEEEPAKTLLLWIFYQTHLLIMRLLVYKQNEFVFEENIKLLNIEVQLRDTALVTLRHKLEKAKQEIDDLKLKLEKFQTSSKNLTDLLASQTNKKTGLRYNSQVFTKAMFDCANYYSSESDYESWPPSNLYDRFQLSGGYHAVPPPYTRTFMPHKPDLVFNTPSTAVETDHLAFNVQLSPTKTEQDLSHTTKPTALIIKERVSDSEEDSKTKVTQFIPSFAQSFEHVKSPRHSAQLIETTIPAATHVPASPKSNSSGKRRNRKACFVCKSVDHLIKDCNYRTKKMAQPTSKTYAYWGHHKQYAPLTHSKPQKHRIPTAVFTQSKPVFNTAIRPVSVALPNITVTRPRHAHQVVTKFKSPIRRYITCSPSSRTNNTPPRVNVVQVLVVSVVQGKQGTWGNPQQVLQDKGVIDSGCSRHMTGNMSYLSDFQKLNGGYVTFGGNPKCGKITGKCKIKTGKLDFDDVYFVKELKFNLFSVSQMCDKKNSVLFTDTECLILSPDFKLPDENQVLLRVPRENNMHNVNLKNIIPFGDLTYLFAKIHLGVFLATKDETTPILKTFLTGLENQLSLRVKVIRSDNGTEFKIYDLNQLCGLRGIKREFSVPRIPQQNGIAERKNKTLIEAVRIMLADLLLLPFWAEAVNTVCYMLPLIKKEHDFDTMKPESAVILSSSSSAQTKNQDDKTKIEDKGNATGPSISAAGPSNTAVSPTYGKSSFTDAFQLPNGPDMPELEDITYSDDEDVVGVEADFNNLKSSIPVSPIPTTRIHKDHPVSQIIELLQFKMQKVWVLVDLPYGKRAIGTKWVYKNKKDERGIVIRNKARLVTQGHTQEEGIDYEEDFAPVARIEAIRLFLAYASFMGFMVYLMDVKSEFLYGIIEEEVYVCQPSGFEDPNHPNKVYRVVKALYGLHQAPRAWYETLATYLLENGFHRGTIGQTLFIKKQKGDILQVKQNKDGIFISQDKYVAEILRKFGLTEGKSASIPIDTEKPLLKDPDGEDVDVHIYRSMIGSLIYLTSSRLDIMFAVCACAHFHVTLKALHLHTVKWIFRYLKGKPHLGLWYPKDSPFDLVAYSDSDYAGASLDKKSITGGYKFIVCRYSWQCKKQTVVATSSIKAEYVVTASCCA
uniref:Uncharacterized protein n=1 Tax=Tanacetum cinerariifolium TaxID=118510 RepID=A0A6L2LH32_TANCI|nr:hypothetical protein [Tanacetum cinerariifolium]